MDTDRPTQELLQRMLAAVVATFGGEEQVDRLVEAARAEAEDEVKDVLKAAIKATLLQRAVIRLEGGSTAAPEPADAAGEGDFAQAPIISPAPDRLDTGEQLDTEDRLDTDRVFGGCYVYGITRAGGPPPPDGLPGVDPRVPLRFVRQGDLEALTSTISLDDFGTDAMTERVKDLAWVEEKVRAHDRVVKHLLARGAVVPCRFCTVLRGEQDVRAVLARHAEGLSAALDAVDGKKEWGVKVTPPARGGVVAAEPTAPGSGKDYFLQKKRDERSRADAARATREAADACHRELSAAAAGAALLPTGDRGIGERRGGDVLLNGAYLVADDNTESFHALVNDLGGRYEPLGLSIEVTGPWPPYNFVSLDLSLDDGPRPATDVPVAPEAAA
jgi:hypothetical protein